MSLKKPNNKTPKLVIVGVIGIDDIITPHAKARAVFGGSAIHAALSAANFVEPALVSIAGEDLPKEFLAQLEQRRVHLEGVKISGLTFRWSGKYVGDMNEAETLDIALNNLIEYKPVLPKTYQNAPFLFLAALDPDIQIDIISQAKSKPFIAIDTKEHWIKIKRESVIKALSLADLVMLNEDETRDLFGRDLKYAAEKILKMGPSFVIIKKGADGSIFIFKNGHRPIAAYRLRAPIDPTGAGDSFAGALMGYLAKVGKRDAQSIHNGLSYGSAIAAYCTEAVGCERLAKLSIKEIEERYVKLKEINKF